jgi:hypothetical protein
MKVVLVWIDSDEKEATFRVAVNMLKLRTAELPLQLAEPTFNAATSTPLPVPAPMEVGEPARRPVGERRPRGNTSGTRPMVPGHVRHSWASEGAADRSVCIKCGMKRQLLDKGYLQFTPRDGGEAQVRPPFGGHTPNCDEGLTAVLKTMSAGR